MNHPASDRRRGRGHALLTATILVAGLGGASATASAAAPESCGGEPATIVGTSGDDDLRGTDGHDVVVARGGADVVTTGKGRDTICGGAGNDLLLGRNGQDLLRGGPGSDVLVGGADRAIIDEPVTYAGDTLDGGGGDDSLFGDLRVDDDARRFDGRDTATYVHAVDAVVGDARGADQQAGASVSIGGGTDELHRIGTIVGSPLADRLRADGGFDTGTVLRGGGGDDRLTGRLLVGDAGADVLRVDRRYGDADGGPGADRILLTGQESVGTGASGPDTIIASVSGTALYGGDGADRLVTSGEGGHRIGPGKGADSVLGGPGRDVVRSFDGPRDTIDTRGGDDEVVIDVLPLAIDVGLGDDTIAAYAFRDRDPVPGVLRADLAQETLTYRGRTIATGRVETYQGSTALPNVVNGSPRDDEIVAGCAADVVHGRAGDDQIQAGTGDDLVRAGAGRDVVTDRVRFGPLCTSRSDDDDLAGGPGRDTIVYERQSPDLSHVLDLAAGTATLYGTDAIAGFEDATGTRQAETLRGDDGPNRIVGISGADLIEGRGGDDTLIGGFRADSTVRGGDGTDTCRGATTTGCEIAGD